MEDPRERLVTSIGTEELERRWRAARAWMATEGVDALLMRNDEEYFGGYVKWFTDIPARHSYPFTVVFPLSGGMTTITSSPPAEPGPKAWALRGGKQRLGAPFYPSLPYTATYDAELAVGALKEMHAATVGIVGRSFFSVPFHEYLTAHLPQVRFVDATGAIDRIKVIKSPAEVELIRQTAALQDKAFAHLLTCVKPGVRELDLFAEVHHVCTRLGSERLQVLTCSYPPGEPAGFNQRHFMNRTLKAGDHVVVLIEGNGPGGYYTEIVRPICLGEPTPEVRAAFAVALEAEALTLSLLKPGAEPREILAAHNAFMESRGYAPEGRLYAHGEGYDLVEQPAMLADEPMRIAAGMNMAVHPVAKNKSVYTTLCGNYLVEEGGVSACLHKTPKELFIV
ncbi:MAG: M24 family metallopeptidase [Deltaproteobacteria bacterium]|nr:M24 family metallopeptidase [Deltaproteobacteria bacterium]